MASYTYSFGRGGWVLKLDAAGNSVWQLAFDNQTPQTVVTTNDGQILVAGQLFVAPGDNDVWVAKLSLAGAIIWEKTYSAGSSELAAAAFSTADGGYLVTGSSSGVGQGADLWLLKLDSLGSTDWQEAYGAMGNEGGTALFENAGRIWVAGYATSFGAGNVDIWVLNLNEADQAANGCLLSAGPHVVDLASAGPVQSTSASGVEADFLPATSDASVGVTAVVGQSQCPFGNSPPVVSAGGPYTVTEGGSVELTAMASDSDGDTLAFAWDLDNNGTYETLGQSVPFSAAGRVVPSSYSVHVRVTDTGGLIATDQTTVTVVYNFTGFFQPVDPLPTLNTMKAGGAVSVKFSLAGNHGLNIFATNSPASATVTCGTTAEDAIEEIVNTGSSSLSYDVTSGQYRFVWKTDKAWAGTCRTLVLKLNDGTYHRANFKFK